MKIKLFNRIIDVDKINLITGILPPCDRRFDDSETSSDSETDWTNRFVIHFNSGGSLTFTDVEFGLEKIKEAREFVLKHYLGYQNSIPSFK